MKKVSKYLVGASALLMAGSVAANSMAGNHVVAKKKVSSTPVIVGYTSATYLRQEVIQMNQDCYRSFGYGARVANTKDLVNTISKGLYKAPTAPQVRILIESAIAIGPNGPARLLHDLNTGYFIEGIGTNELSFTPDGSMTSSPNSAKAVACAR
ncbi:MAG TPA: hypothetical protein ENJ08_02160 [Gammaproteobacteria bacterium]|nr:hypothetical protein [Gammaproteobacteria bacterium]